MQFFSKPYKAARTVVFKISVGQGYNSRRMQDEYILNFDKSRMMFCSPNSVAADYKC